MAKANRQTVYPTGFWFTSIHGRLGKLIICPMAMYIKIIANIVKRINFVFSFLFFPSTFISLNSPKLLNPAFFTNSFKFSIVKIFSSYSILAFAITKFTCACFIPFCLFKYFSKPFEQALHVIPSIDNTIFFILNLLSLYQTQYLLLFLP